MHALLFGLDQAKLNQRRFSPRHKAWRGYDQICQWTNQYEPPPEKRPRGKFENTKGRNLAERLAKYKSEALRFAPEPNIPFSNNQAERDLCPIKGKQKVADCFRTFQGAQRYARIQSVFSSWKKQCYSIFKELKAILDGNAFEFEV